MRIGMILDNVYPHDSRVRDEADFLIKAGHELFLYCLDFGGKGTETEILSGLHIYRHGISKLYHKLSALAYTLPLYHMRLRKSIGSFLSENQIEIIHVHDIQSARSVFWANSSSGLPVVLDLHENRPEIMKYYPHVRKLTGRLTIFPAVWKRFEYRYLRKADEIVVVTDQARDHYVKQVQLPAEKFTVIPNTVQEAYYTNYDVHKAIIDKYSKDFTLGYIGDTGHRRGLETCIRSLPYLSKEIPEIKLLIVGKSKDDYLLRDLVKDLKVESYVDLAGYQAFSKTPSYILGSAIGICPLQRNIHHDTTYANKIFMYMSLGRPLIVSDCDAQAAVVEENECGLVFKAGDARDFATKVLDLYNDEKLRAHYARNGKEAVIRKFHWEKTTLELEELYNKYEQKRF